MGWLIWMDAPANILGGAIKTLAAYLVFPYSDVELMRPCRRLPSGAVLRRISLILLPEVYGGIRRMLIKMGHLGLETSQAPVVRRSTIFP